MTESEVLTALWTGAFLLVHLGVIARVILRPHREPASRVAWIVVIIVLPVGGNCATLLPDSNASIARSHPVTAETVAQWPMTRRLWNNTIAMLGPIL